MQYRVTHGEEVVGEEADLAEEAEGVGAGPEARDEENLKIKWHS